MNIIKRKEYLIVFIGILLFGVLAALLFDLSVVKEGMAFSLYTILGMLIPGCAAIELLRLDVKTDVEHITYALFLGYIISFFEYFLIVPFGIQKYGFVVALLVTVLSIVYLIKKGNRLSLEKDISGFWICLVISAVYIGIRFFTTGGAGSVPVRLDTVNVDWDTFWWIGDTIELKHHFPPSNFRKLGRAYNYHYFSSLQLAVTSVITGIKPIFLNQFFYYLISSSMIVYGGYSVFAKCTSSVLLRFLAVFSFVFTSGMTTWTRNIYAEMLFVRPFALDYGLGMLMFVILLVLDLIEAKEFNIKVILEVVVFALLCGIKANYGSIALVIVGLSSLKWLFQKEERWKVLIIGIANLLVFVFIYLFVTNIKNYNASGVVEASFVESDILNHGKTAKLYDVICYLPIPNIISKVIFLFVYSFMSHPMVFGTSYYQVIRSFFRKKKIVSTAWIIFIAMMISSGLRVFVGIAGYSETYFIYAAYPLGLMFILLNWKKQCNLEDSKYIIKMSCFFALFIMSLFFNYHRRGTDYIADRGIIGAKNILGYGESEIDYDKPYVSTNQIEAYEWIKDNTGYDDELIIVSNKPTLFTAGVYSERYFFAFQEDTTFEEGFDLNNSELQNKITELEAPYIVYILDELDEYQGRKQWKAEFENEEVVIYKVNSNGVIEEEQ